MRDGILEKEKFSVNLELCDCISLFMRLTMIVVSRIERMKGKGEKKCIRTWSIKLRNVDLEVLHLISQQLEPYFFEADDIK